MPGYVTRLTVAILLGASMVCVAGDRIDPALRARAATEQRSRVLIVLSHQPQSDIVRQVEASRQAEEHAAWRRLNQTVRAPFSLDQDVREARAELDRIVLEIRRTAVEEIQQIIQPQQDRVSFLLRSWGATNIHALTVVNVITAEVPSSILATLDASPDVAEVFPAARFHPDLSVSVPAILAPTFWAAHSRGVGESVGVLDSGVMTTNPGFNGLSITSQVFLTQGSTDPCFGDDQTPNDHLGHGTHVAGIVASQGAGSCTTCIGTAPGINLYNLKVGWVVKSGDGCPGGGEAYDQDVLDAMDWAVTNTPVNVFNFSYGGTPTGDDDGTSQMFDQIGASWGVNIVIAAGNTGGANVETPGISWNGVTVSSIDDQDTVDRSDDVVSSFSSRGPTSAGRYKPDISAPGSHHSFILGILSTYINGDYARLEGTSMAAPHAAGALALIRSAGAQDGLAAKAILLNTAYNAASGWPTDRGWGWGFVDLSQASAQVSNYLDGSVSAGKPAFYSGTVTGTLKTTLVWNREVTANCTPTSCPASNLELYVYDGASGDVLGPTTSPSTIQNVQQVVTTAGGATVLQVVPITLVSGITSEPYALAVSASGFTAKNGPSLSVSCTGPSGPVALNATFTVPCTVTNNGDLTAFSVQGTLSWQGSTGTPNQFGTLTASQQSSAQSWQITAPSSAGLYTLEAAVSSASYGETFTGTAAFPVTVGQVYTLTTGASPSGSAVVTASPAAPGGVYGAGTQVCLTATPNSGWVFSSWSGTALDSNKCLIMNGNASVVANFSTSAQFSDVAPSATFFDAANLMFQDNVTTGCVQSSDPATRQFCPNDNVTRQEMAAFIVRAVTGTVTPAIYNTTPYFQDVDSSNPFFPHIQKLMDLGITTGCSQNPPLYCPTDTIPRWEMAMFMVRARLALYGASFSTATTPYFSDVPTNVEGNGMPFPSIQRSYEEHITNGCGGSLYCPDELVTRGQMASFIMRGLFNETMVLASGAPMLTGVAPNAVAQTLGSQITVTITGANTNFQSGDTVTVPSGMLAVSDVVVNSATSISATLTVNANAVAGPQALVVTTGGQNLTLPLAIKVGSY